MAILGRLGFGIPYFIASVVLSTPYSQSSSSAWPAIDGHWQRAKEDVPIQAGTFDAFCGAECIVAKSGAGLKVTRLEYGGSPVITIGTEASPAQNKLHLPSGDVLVTSSFSLANGVFVIRSKVTMGEMQSEQEVHVSVMSDGRMLAERQFFRPGGGSRPIHYQKIKS
jgi:hypothetical protein